MIIIGYISINCHLFSDKSWKSFANYVFFYLSTDRLVRENPVCTYSVLQIHSSLGVYQMKLPQLLKKIEDINVIIFDEVSADDHLNHCSIAIEPLGNGTIKILILLLL